MRGGQEKGRCRQPWEINESPPGKGPLGMSKVKANSPDSPELPWVWTSVDTVTVRLMVVGPSLERCPRIQGNCEFKERDECSKNKKCPKHEKCCFFSCGRKCLNLQQGKHILRASITNPSTCILPFCSSGLALSLVHQGLVSEQDCWTWET